MVTAANTIFWVSCCKQESRIDISASATATIPRMEKDEELNIQHSLGAVFFFFFEALILPCAVLLKLVILHDKTILLYK